MPEIEDRLRASLDTLANEVPPTSHARIQLYRRLGARRRRPRPFLAAAAVLAVMAAVFVPIALSGGDGSTPPATRSSTATTTQEVTKETGLAVFGVGGAGTGPNAWGLVLVKDVVGDRFCFIMREGDDWNGDQLCFAPPTFTGDQLVIVRNVAEMTEDMEMPPVVREGLPHAYLFFTRPPVTQMTVRGINREWSTVSSSHLPDEPISVFYAYVTGEPKGAIYKVKDEAGRILQQGAT